MRDADKISLVRQKAIELIATHGLEGFSMNKLAKACGISVATLYIYYKDRDDLILKIAVEEGNIMGAAMIVGFDPEMSLEEGLRKQWENRCNYSMKNPKTSLFLNSYEARPIRKNFSPRS